MSENVQYNSFDELVNIANTRHNIIIDSNSKELLKVYPYYTLINGYQQALKESPTSEKFREGISIDFLASIHVYESMLSSQFLSALLSIEINLKNLMQDAIGKHFGIMESEYLDVNNYLSLPDREHTFRTIKDITENRNSVSKSLKHYREKEGNVPPWILMNDLMFGPMVKLYLMLPEDIKLDILNNYDHFGLSSLEFKTFFKKALSILHDYRNGFAHGDVLNKIHPKKFIPIETLHHLYSEEVITLAEFNNQKISKRDTFGLILVLFALAPNEFKTITYAGIRSTLEFLNELMNLDSPDMRKILGLPDRFIERLDLIYKLTMPNLSK